MRVDPTPEDPYMDEVERELREAAAKLVPPYDREHEFGPDGTRLNDLPAVRATAWLLVVLAVGGLLTYFLSS